MKKFGHIALKIVFSLLLIMPILGVIGIFPEPTADLYNTDRSFAFIQALYEASYVMYLLAIVNFLALISLWTKREALAALLVLPITLNIIGFHIFLDGGIFTPGAIMADLLVLVNIYFLCKNRSQYMSLIKPSSQASSTVNITE